MSRAVPLRKSHISRFHRYLPCIEDRKQVRVTEWFSAPWLPPQGALSLTSMISEVQTLDTILSVESTILRILNGGCLGHGGKRESISNIPGSAICECGANGHAPTFHRILEANLAPMQSQAAVAGAVRWHERLAGDFRRDNRPHQAEALKDSINADAFADADAGAGAGAGAGADADAGALSLLTPLPWNLCLLLVQVDTADVPYAPLPSILYRGFSRLVFPLVAQIPHFSHYS